MQKIMSFRATSRNLIYKISQIKILRLHFVLLRMTLFFTFVFILFPIQIASAHVLKTDNTIGAILHVNPEDDPIAGEPTQFFFALKDTTNKFSTDNCNCTVRITQNGKTLEDGQGTIDPDYDQALLFTYTFTKKGMYQIAVIGKPEHEPTFQPFQLTYDIRVAREKETQDQSQSLPLLPILVSVIIGSILIAYFLKRK